MLVIRDTSLHGFQSITGKLSLLLLASFPGQRHYISTNATKTSLFLTGLTCKYLPEMELALLLFTTSLIRPNHLAGNTAISVSSGGFFFCILFINVKLATLFGTGTFCERRNDTFFITMAFLSGTVGLSLLFAKKKLRLFTPTAASGICSYTPLTNTIPPGISTLSVCIRMFDKEFSPDTLTLRAATTLAPILHEAVTGLAVVSLKSSPLIGIENTSLTLTDGLTAFFNFVCDITIAISCPGRCFLGRCFLKLIARNSFWGRWGHTARRGP